MRRKGRQHGMVVYRKIDPEISHPKSRIINELKTAPATKFMTRVSSKPTNHYRYTTGWCSSCRCALCSNHSYPINKSRQKAKGTHKYRHKADVAVNHLLVSHKAVGSACRDSWVRFDYGSANWLLSQLADDDISYDDDCYDMDWVDHDENCLNIGETEKRKSGGNGILLF